MNQLLSYESFDRQNSLLYALEDFDTNVSIKFLPYLSEYIIEVGLCSCCVFDATIHLDGTSFDTYDEALYAYKAAWSSLASAIQLEDVNTVGHFNEPMMDDEYGHEDVLAPYVSDEEMAKVYRSMYSSTELAKTPEELEKEYNERLWKAIKDGSR